MAKLLTNNMHALDIRDLARRGALEPSNQAFVNWSCNGQHTGAIGFKVGEDMITLSYLTMPRNGTAWQSADQPIRLVTTPCHYGGSRQWFACPGCGGRVAILYVNRLTACRKCHDLAYQVQRESLAERYTRRLAKVRKRLGWPGGFLNDRRGQPAGMYLRTYFRLQLEHERLVAQIVKYESQRIGLTHR
ncbi:hypothetical protein OL229_13665 [Neisseriaceae bacterium JH1-16]|nr:hypothetical protein [Neisseriaceae bacterium JH1-16]